MNKGKLIAIELTIILTLVGVIYGILNRDIDRVKADVSTIQEEHQSLDSTIQNMAGNIWLLCQQTKNIRCIPPK